MIRNWIKMEVGEGNREAVISLLRGLVQPTLAEPGCLDCCLGLEITPFRHVCFTSKWEDQATLNRFLRSDAYRRILNAAELASHEPEINFEMIGTVHGLGYVETVFSDRT